MERGKKNQTYVWMTSAVNENIMLDWLRSSQFNEPTS